MQTLGQRTRTGPLGRAPDLLVEPSPDVGTFGLPVPRYPLVSLAALDAMQDPAYLVDGLIPEHGLIMLHGQPSAGKSLLALDWSLSIASGASTWMGRTLRTGRVVYVAAEGRGGLKQRVAAWRQRWGLEGVEPQFQFILSPIPLLAPETAEFVLEEIGAVNQPAPALLVVDTLARCTPGGDENDAGSMSQAIGTLDRIRQDTGGAVLLLHHNRKDSNAERGSTALRGAADVVLALGERDGVRELEVTKNRDGETDVKVRFQLLPEGDSVVLIPEPAEGSSTDLTRSAQKVLEAYREIYTGEPVRTADWRDVVAPMAPRTFHAAVADLVRRGIVRHPGKRRPRGEYEPGPQFTE